MPEDETKANSNVDTDTNVVTTEQVELPPKPQVAILPVEWIGEDGKKYIYDKETDTWNEKFDISTPLDNPKHELFCKVYTEPWTSMYCNGSQSYAHVYWLDLTNQSKANTARTNAHKLLMDTYILKRIRQLLDLWWLNDESVDGELLLVIKQNAEMPSKVAAIREYNKLRQRIIDKLDVNVDVVDVSKMNPQEKMTYLQSKLGRQNGSAKKS